MTDHHKGWRGDREGRRAPEEQGAPGWKQSRRRAEASAGGRRPWFRIIGLFVMLLLLVAAAIYLFLDPVRQVTYLDVVAGFELSDQTEQGRENWVGGIASIPDAASVPAPGSNQVLGGQSSTTAQRSVAGWKDALTELAAKAGFRNIDGETILLFLQTGFVPGDGQSVVILSGHPSSPDLIAGEFESVAALKDSVKALLEDRSRVNVLLMVDTPPMDQSFRFGQYGINAAEICSSWTAEAGFERLAVITSCGKDQVSWPLSMGAGGRTAFAQAAMNGLTAAADSNQDRDVRVSEYFEYIRRQTEEWVSKHRGAGLQTIAVYPALSEPGETKSSRDFIVIRNPAAAEPTFAGGGKDEEIEARLESLWGTRDALYRKAAYRWSPVSCTAATDRLRLAEVSYLSGNFAAAQRLMSHAERHLKEIERVTSALLKSEQDLSINERLPASLFEGLPSFARLQELKWWNAERAPSAEKTDVLAPEDVLKQAIALRAFDAESRPADDIVARLMLERSRAESATAVAWGSAAVMQRTALAYERQTAAREDQFFVQPSLYPAQDASWDAMSHTAQLRNVAMLRLAESSAELPGHVEWSAYGTNPADSLSRVLSENLTISDDQLETFWRSAESVLNRVPDEEPATALQRSIVRQIIATRGVWVTCEQLSAVNEPQEGYAARQLEEYSGQLQQWLTRLTEARNDAATSITALLNAAVGNDPSQEKAVPAENRLQRYHEYRNLQRLTVLTAAQRKLLVGMIRRIDGVLADGETLAETGTGASSSPIVPCFQASGAKQLRWQSQLLTLAPGLMLANGAQDAASNETEAVDQKPIELLRGIQSSLSISNEAELNQKLQAAGVGIRAFWKAQRIRIEQVLRNQSASTDELTGTEMRSRLLPAFDAVVFCADPEPNRLTRQTLTRLKHDYCLLNARRAMQSGWIVQSEQNTGSGRTPWFQQIAAAWCKDVPAQLSDSVLKSKGVWSAKSEFSKSMVRFTDEGEQTCEVKVTVVDPDGFLGTPALQIKPGASGDLRVYSELLITHSEKTLTSLSLPIAASSNTGDLPQQPAGFGFRLKSGELLGDECRPVEYDSQVFFRGRLLNLAKLQVDPCEGKSWLVSRAAAPPNAELALQTPDMRPIAFVLDWSGSMKEPLGNGGATGQNRAEEAARAILEILDLQSELRKASLRVFGHRADWRKLNTKFADSFKEFPIAEPAAVPITSEETFRDSQGLIAQTSLTASGKEVFKKAFDCLRSSEPFGNTPLVYSLVEAVRNDLQSRSGIIVAVTDGEALDSGSNPEYEKYNRISELEAAIQEARGDVQILLISFDVNDPAIRQKISAPFQTDLLKRHCTVIDAADRTEILKQLEKKLAPPSLVIRADGQEIEVTGTRTEEKDFRYEATLAPDTSYRLQYGKITNDQFGPVVLTPGDQLNMQIDWIRSRFRFLRQPRHKAAAAMVGGASAGDDPTVLAAAAQPVMTDQSDGTKTVRLQLMVDHDDADRPVRRPAEIEFEYQPAVDGGATDEYRYPARVTERLAQGVGAPAWDVELSEWPRSGVRVNSFWKMSRTSPDLVLTWEQLKVAQSRSLAIETDKAGASQQLPSSFIWWRLLPDGRLQIRVDRDTAVPQSDENAVADVRVEVGKRDTIGNAGSFVPKSDVNVLVSRMENGDVVWEFDGQWTEDSLNALEFAFTSRSSRISGATRLRTPLELTDFRTVSQGGSDQ